MHPQCRVAPGSAGPRFELRRQRTPGSRGPRATMGAAKGTRLVSLFVIQAILVQAARAADDPGPACNIVCGRDYNPVCAEYQGAHRTFSNPCMMTYYNCRSGTDFTILQRNECPEDSKDDKHKK